MLSIKNIFAVATTAILLSLINTNASFAAYEGSDIPDGMCDPNFICLDFTSDDPEPQPNVAIPEPTSVLGIIAIGGLMVGMKKGNNKKQ